MTLTELLRISLLPNSLTKKSIELESPTLEQSAKLVAVSSAVCFAIGVAYTAVFYASVSLRPFEPLNFQQVFLGVLFLLYASISFVIPTKMGLRSPMGWAIQLVILATLLIDSPFMSHLFYLLGARVAHLDSTHFFIVVGDKLISLLWFCAAAMLFRLLAILLKSPPRNGSATIICTFLVAIVASLVAFGTTAYPRIPLALGGGDFPIVRIDFTKNAPYILTSEFDISLSNPKYEGSRYYGRLVYETSESFYLSSAFWYSPYFVEVRRSDVVMVRFGNFNPTTFLLPPDNKN